MKVMLEIFKNIKNSIILIGTHNKIEIDDGGSILYVPTKIDWSIRENREIKSICPQKIHADTNMERAIMIEDYLQKILFYCSKENLSPTLRLYSHFSPFSTIKNESDHADIDKLELSEKSLLMKWARNGFPVRVIISLQPGLIHMMSYNQEQYVERSRDLCQTLKELRNYKNVEFVVDDVCAWDSLYIFDTILYCSSGNQCLDKESATYGSADFIPNIELVRQKIQAFDERFMVLKRRNDLQKKAMEIDEQERFIRNMSRLREEKYLEEEEH